MKAENSIAMGIISHIRKVFSSPLSRQYLSWMFVFSTMLSITLTSMEIYAHYQGLQNEIKLTLDRIGSTYLKALRNSLWEYHSEQSQLIIDGITLDNRIKAVEIRNGLLNLKSGNAQKNNNAIKEIVPIYIKSLNKDVYLGDLVVYSNYDWVVEQTYTFAIVRLLSNFTKSIVIVLFSFFTFRILVNRHLEVISAFVSSENALRMPVEKLEIKRNPFAYGGRDEIDEVVFAVNQFGSELQVHISKLITMTREAEVVNLRLLEAMRMELLGKQVGSITHEFRNSLAIISGALELIFTSDKLPYEVIERLEVAKSSVNTASEITNHLLGYSKKNILLSSLIRMDEFSKELERILTILIGTKNNLIVLSMTRKVLYINKEILLSSIINLVKNANEALSNNGHISVIINDLSESSKIHNGLDLNKSYVVINVIDDGQGVPDELRDKLFEPFITTKSAEGGVGLGLWTVYNFIKQISGLITYQNAEGGGGHFSLILPVDQKPFPTVNSA